MDFEKLAGNNVFTEMDAFFKASKGNADFEKELDGFNQQHNLSVAHGVDSDSDNHSHSHSQNGSSKRSDPDITIQSIGKQGDLTKPTPLKQHSEAKYQDLDNSGNTFYKSDSKSKQ
mmetsp:Transcript_48707/g.106085  ORF Transcript_48707/g.106085 Transcript_48707/m.106085 type:complete len:116 (-) Transcript_48707:421-768(-)